jgi:hypothetical protein
VFVWFALGLLDPPIATRFGPWYLAPPLVLASLPAIPVGGIDSISGNVPSNPPPPYAIHAQAAILSGPVLTNLATVDVH